MEAGAERRGETRQASDEAITLVARSGQPVYEGMAVDRSLRGMRVRMADAARLPTELTVLSRATGSALRAKVVWRASPYVGLSITRSIDIRTASGPEAEEVRRLWREHISG